MTAYAIEDGVPIPPPRKGNYKYPIRDLAIGQSFFVECEETKAAQELLRTIHRSARGTGIKLTVRIVEKGVRAWRVE